MGSLQLIGKDAVIDAFNDLKGETWALFDGKSPIMYGQGAESLDEWLERFSPAGSTSQYVIRIYDVEPPIKPNTDYIAALRFRLHDPYGGAGIAGHSTKLMDRLAAIEKKIDGDDSDEEDIPGILMGWLKEPEKLETAVGAFRQLMGYKNEPALPPAENLQSMGGFKVSSTDNQDSEEKLERLAAILDKLEKRDPKLIDHLDKLSKLDAITFNLVISKVDAL